jgi:hypothetical protein
MDPELVDQTPALVGDLNQEAQRPQEKPHE